MSTVDWRSASCCSASSVRVSEVDAYAKGAARLGKSPVDEFYLARKELLRSANPTLLNENPVIGPLLLVGFVAATESYFRDLFSGIVSLCPIAQTSAARERVSLGTVLWHRGHLLERGAFELISFTSAENVKDTARKFAAFSVKPNSAVDVALAEYEKICELRHGIVHSGGVIAGKNALKLELRYATPSSTIAVGFGELQECAAVCSSLVAATNREFFVEIVRRWAVEWRRLAGWRSENVVERFEQIWRLFHSLEDATAGRVPVLDWRGCMALVCEEYKCGEVF